MTTENEERLIKYGIIFAIILVIVFLLSCENVSTNEDRLNDYLGKWYQDNELIYTISLNGKELKIVDKFGAYYYNYYIKDSLYFSKDKLKFIMIEENRRAKLLKYYDNIYLGIIEVNR